MDSAMAAIPKPTSYELLVSILFVPKGMTAYLTDLGSMIDIA